MTVARRCRFLQTPRAMRKAKLYCIGRPRERMANGEPRPGATRHSPFATHPIPTGGARRDRTDDLMLAKHALSQLSYGPDAEIGERFSNPIADRRHPITDLVGLGGLEPPTSRLSSARSNQLSYKPFSEDRGRSTEYGSP
jgi:hypothetical protein